MKHKRFTEEQIISILKENEAGISVPDLPRRHGFAEGTFYTWRSKFGGMDVSDAKKLRELEAENTRLKRLLAEEMLDKAALKDALSVRLDCHKTLANYLYPKMRSVEWIDENTSQPIVIQVIEPK